MSTSHNKIPMFSKEEYDDWKIRMQAHLVAQDDDMWFVITYGPMKIMKANTTMSITAGAPQWIKRQEWSIHLRTRERPIWITWRRILFTRRWTRICSAKLKPAPLPRRFGRS
ncbi:hypothetical protein F511_39133 [Dorcoceras hygrometricum]|uniref:DUF4219 domain-containing protein n=1 Tax=Dorcoceras hygrometricum TaxID=472368 RepID=A0A2Z7BW88_9LAMI|nr:hypothetical protein F511_39133 [Dorcoceras hygrometricum]